MYDKPILGVENIKARPDSASSSHDILHSVLQQAAGQPEGKLEEKLQRVIEKAKHVKAASQSNDDRDGCRTTPTGRVQSQSYFDDQAGRTTPQAQTHTQNQAASGRITPQNRQTSLDGTEARAGDTTPRSSERSNAKPFQWQQQQQQHQYQQNGPNQSYQQTAASVNRIISRHRTQPSIASILSDISGPSPHNSSREIDDDDEGSTPLTATSSTHPTTPPSYSTMTTSMAAGAGGSVGNGTGSIFTRNIAAPSPTPRVPVSYSDDFGIKALMAIVQARAREMQPAKKVELINATDEVERLYYGARIQMDQVPQEVKNCFGGIQGRLDTMDREIDGLLAEVMERQMEVKAKQAGTRRSVSSMRSGSRASRASLVESLRE
jgi:hypothetical protein